MNRISCGGLFVKIIFLDFDGVLNTAEFLDKLEPVPYATHLGAKLLSRELDPVRVQCINDIVELTGAKVVVTSAWRVGSTLQWLEQVLRHAGFVGEVVGKTQRFYGRPRSEEIQDWLEFREQEIESFVILDDDVSANIEGHFIETSFHEGLTKAHVPQAIEILFTL